MAALPRAQRGLGAGAPAGTRAGGSGSWGSGSQAARAPPRGRGRVGSGRAAGPPRSAGRRGISLVLNISRARPGQPPPAAALRAPGAAPDVGIDGGATKVGDTEVGDTEVGDTKRGASRRRRPPATGGLCRYFEAA